MTGLLAALRNLLLRQASFHHSLSPAHRRVIRSDESARNFEFMFQLCILSLTFGAIHA